MEWVSLGGGLYFTKEGYPLDAFCARLRAFAARHGVQVYLEPGESSITRSAELVTTVVDIVRNKATIAIVDASVEAHMLDLLIYRIPAKIDNADTGRYEYTVAGRSCLAGDVFGTFRFKKPLRVGQHRPVRRRRRLFHGEEELVQRAFHAVDRGEEAQRVHRRGETVFVQRFQEQSFLRRAQYHETKRIDHRRGRRGARGGAQVRAAQRRSGRHLHRVAHAVQVRRDHRQRDHGRTTSRTGRASCFPARSTPSTFPQRSSSSRRPIPRSCSTSGPRLSTCRCLRRASRRA